MLKKLIALDFEKAGEWVLNDGDLELMINKHSEKNNILYSFVVDGEIKYIGKSIRTFKKRMYGYHKPGNTQTTNIEKNDLIINSLKHGKVVEIFLWYDSDPPLFNLFTEMKEENVETPFSFNPDFITKKIAKYYKSAKIKGANTHSLRKTFGSLLIQNKTADIYTVSKLLGHASIKTTEKYYVDLIDDNYKIALDGLDNII